MENYHFWITVGIGFFLGFSSCFYGFRFFKYLCGGVWALTGFYGGLSVSPNLALALPAAIVLASLGAYLGYRFYLFSVFLAGAVTGLVVGETLINWQRNPDGIYIILAMGAIAGGICVWWQKKLIILSTALNGAWVLLFSIRLAQLGSKGFELHFGKSESQWGKVWHLIKNQELHSLLILGGLFLMGYWIQSRYTAREDPSPKEEKKKKKTKEKKS